MPQAMSDNPGTQPVLKRKRTSIACNSCHAKKSKCDGKRPVCGRCSGYGFQCSWGRETSRREPSLSVDAATSREIFDKYHEAVNALAADLTPGDREEVTRSLACIQTHLCPRRSSEVTTVDSHSASGASPTLIQRVQSPRYVGEVSDVHFYNLVRQTAVREGENGQDDAGEVDNYDTEALTTMEYLQNPLSDMPTGSQVDRYLNVYFSTIHVAYPFVDKESFKGKLDTLQAHGSDADLTHSWLSLLYALLAIGAYYSSFRLDSRQDGLVHQKLLQRSLVLSHQGMLGRSLAQVSALLAQCFYLLATSDIDRCWASLGLAIRIAQSIGLHAEVHDNERTRSQDRPSWERPQVRSRVWYSLYVLDRLTALQLGRPPAISDHDCHVPIPSRIDDLNPEINHEFITSDNHKHGGEYFVRVIEFSSIIGRVLRECYHPRHDLEIKLKSTTDCDALLLAWRQRLPRFLRFDLGHAFEKSVTLKRQRNMLAVKFHHLRALIHRPYLLYMCLDKGSLPSDLHDLSRAYGRICASEAQSIARLVHNVTDTMDIVMNYPWWQMVSCLVCAGSIMVMAGALLKQEPNSEASVAALEEDVETCMDVLKALSDNSRGSKLAWDMMRTIRARCSGASGRESTETSQSLARSNTEAQQCQDGLGLSQTGYCGVSDTLALPLAGTEVDGTSLPIEYASGIDLGLGLGDTMWPMMIPDPANWPGPFLDMLQGSYALQETRGTQN